MLMKNVRRLKKYNGEKQIKIDIPAGIKPLVLEVTNIYII